jgi:FixJ family two-component response regulator
MVVDDEKAARILELVAAGVRDDEAAYELGMSVTSYRKARAKVLRARRRLPREKRLPSVADFECLKLPGNDAKRR